MKGNEEDEVPPQGPARGGFGAARAGPARARGEIYFYEKSNMAAGCWVTPGLAFKGLTIIEKYVSIPLHQ